ncbi:tRNA lysidine(34) synthetase TilS [Candidatus Nomurabacteria bacterium]|nr:tRNA lysidine(34) synthetase TilS [Candidatus Nomurabacteria bacterium]
MRYIVAVSGGVDSVVLLDMMARSSMSVLAVAHFEHGIRGENSKSDARFVERLSQKYRLNFEIKHGNLSKYASESEAREKRYSFLRDLAKKYEAKIVTAHHMDDLVETVAINIRRGTGWRGLAVLAAEDVYRPLLGMRKKDIYDYALAHNLEFVEDETNHSDDYLRNRIRRQTGKLNRETVKEIADLRNKQCELSGEISKQLNNFSDGFSRYFMTMIDDGVAIEILRRQTSSGLTTPQLRAVLLGIKTAKAGKVLEVGSGWEIRLLKKTYTVQKRQR